MFVHDIAQPNAIGEPGTPEALTTHIERTSATVTISSATLRNLYEKLRLIHEDSDAEPQKES